LLGGLPARGGFRAPDALRHAQPADLLRIIEARAETAHFDAFLARLHERLRESALAPTSPRLPPGPLAPRSRASAAGERAAPPPQLFGSRSLAALSTTLAQLRVGNEERVQPTLDLVAAIAECRAADCAPAELAVLVVALAVHAMVFSVPEYQWGAAEAAPVVEAAAPVAPAAEAAAPVAQAAAPAAQ
jgi:hypothetical protein